MRGGEWRDWIPEQRGQRKRWEDQGSEQRRAILFLLYPLPPLDAAKSQTCHHSVEEKLVPCSLWNMPSSFLSSGRQDPGTNKPISDSIPAQINPGSRGLKHELLRFCWIFPGSGSFTADLLRLVLPECCLTRRAQVSIILQSHSRACWSHE